VVASEGIEQRKNAVIRLLVGIEGERPTRAVSACRYKLNSAFWLRLLNVGAPSTEGGRRCLPVGIEGKTNDQLL
jgi:hypothetical protein